MKQSGTLEVAVLGLLKDRPMHGYELRKQLGARLGPLWQVSWGSLYPTLRRLARQGAVQSHVEERRSTKTASGALGAGRRKTVYHITAAGEELFSRLLEEATPAVDEEHFTLKLAFFRYLNPETRVALLERRRAYLQEKLAQFKSNLRNYRERMDAYALSLQSHDMKVTERDIEWIDELITNEIEPDDSSRRSVRREAPRAAHTRVRPGRDS
jgi:DNA-binding PadR family transcriptional regulator